MDCGPARDWAGGLSGGVGVVEDARGCKNWGGEAGGDDNVVVLTGLICSDEYGIGLTTVDV